MEICKMKFFIRPCKSLRMLCIASFIVSTEMSGLSSCRAFKGCRIWSAADDKFYYSRIQHQAKWWEYYYVA